jgi:hypothetical protein
MREEYAKIVERGLGHLQRFVSSLCTINRHITDEAKYQTFSDTPQT